MCWGCSPPYPIDLGFQPTRSSSIAPAPPIMLGQLRSFKLLIACLGLRREPE